MKLEFAVTEGQFSEAILFSFQILLISRQLNDFWHLLQMLQIFADLLLQQESNQSAKLLDFIADLAVETNLLSFLVTAYSRIGKQLSSQQEYDKAIRVFKKMLKVVWILNDHK